MVYQIKLKKGYPYILAMLMLASCSAGKYAATNKVYKKKAGEFAEAIKSMPPVGQGVVLSDPTLQSWVGSVNFGIRRPNFVVLHHTAQKSSDQTIKTFTIAKTEVSAHYVVGRDGKVIQMVNDYLRANHAGVGKWGNDTDLNSSSIGIEIDNSGTEPYSEVQLQSLMTLLSTLKSRYKIPTANFIGHSDLAPRRKVDPANFPWKRFAEKGYGLWYDSVLVMPPDNFDATLALKIIGYDVSNLPAAIVAFKIHFVQTDVTPELTPAVKLILFNLYKKYM
ncbi:N-acetylmuramoyl-L-alanine amidase [Pedobacter panaciterrae]|jgi:Negative regulator of beta-lactamase expression|uniref:N-acetylmuramoyl-L-alanine amidase n=1 Tax=Pedobacter panaciterrae TaxID=363849 RepID=UPI00155DA472|nr:N-acetylmuramoyl-L-alanine amidase [Pedobacter panaciterrae]NQX55527.1 N-acetylmuramoyl-L-alanine amidase [Pedobacter panaciterrae]